MKNKNLNMLIVGMLLFCIIAVMLFVFLFRAHEKFDDSVTVTEKGITETVFKVRDLSLIPTEKKEYHVKLYCDATGHYDISVDFREIYDGGMKDFVVVRILLEGDQVYVGRLSELLDDDVLVEFIGELHETDPLTLTFSYEMPRDTGNEAQGTFSDFDIKLTIKKS